jgi:hypothetical protein
MIKQQRLPRLRGRGRPLAIVIGRAKQAWDDIPAPLGRAHPTSNETWKIIPFRKQGRRALRRKLVQLLVVAAILAPGTVFAGWEAIACDVKGSGACGSSYGWAKQGAAEARAMIACRTGGYICYIYRWEHIRASTG